MNKPRASRAGRGRIATLARRAVNGIPDIEKYDFLRGAARPYKHRVGAIEQVPRQPIPAEAKCQKLDRLGGVVDGAFGRGHRPGSFHIYEIPFILSQMPSLHVACVSRKLFYFLSLFRQFFVLIIV